MGHRHCPHCHGHGHGHHQHGDHGSPDYGEPYPGPPPRQYGPERGDYLRDLEERDRLERRLRRLEQELADLRQAAPPAVRSS